MHAHTRLCNLHCSRVHNYVHTFCARTYTHIHGEFCTENLPSQRVENRVKTAVATKSHKSTRPQNRHDVVAAAVVPLRRPRVMMCVVLLAYADVCVIVLLTKSAHTLSQSRLARAPTTISPPQSEDN